MLVQNYSLPKEPPRLQDMVLEQCRSHSKSQWGLSHAGEPRLYTETSQAQKEDHIHLQSCLTLSP